MDTMYQIDNTLDVPIYQQLVDTIQAAVKKGTLTAGQKLPTVQEMSENLGIARGTIKRAYDELERMGLVEKGQGRGTFVRYQPAHSGSRKERAMAAIDQLLDELEEMGLSASEINIFLNLKLKERAEKDAYIKVAVVECNPENLSQMSEQLRHLPGVDIYSYLMESIQQYPYTLGDGFDLIVTTAAHASYLEEILPEKRQVVRVAIRPSTGCLSDIIRLRAGQRVGIVGYSSRFSQLLHTTCATYAEGVDLAESFVFGPNTDLSRYLRDKDAVLVPKYYEKLFGDQANEALRQFRGSIIECHYVMDEGSLLYLETKIKRLLEEKSI